ncbi:glycerol-3-phosphate dehydrogenase/oxidase [Sporosarcina koreensis]|uniref:glycerol-3-phosphate dehydrogenase/oxidase n=1 Tax=Sporosarcina koreensis TaxID=334735 RepID=UPI00075ADD19|nr:glycerol-3-phosphate dehydrogenase/oxidase [Sporosarcina koreensis]
MKTFSFTDREVILQKLDDQHYDVVIVGGGITGVGIALDCVTRGLKTVLVEMQDFAAGTSSRSTKLVHGGLRYLKQFEVGMVAEVGKEREVVYRNAPHVTHPEWMLLPIYKKGTFGKYSTSVGLKVYDFLAGVKKNERRKMLDRKQTVQREPLLNKTGLIGSGYYVEYRTDDARLTIEVAKKAFEHGAALINYAKAESFTYDASGKVNGLYFKDLVSGSKYRVRGSRIVNATGPWVESVIGMDRKIEGKSLFHSKGVHIVIDGSKFPLQQAIYFDTPDGRMVFAIPRNGKAYIGTTDTEYKGDLQLPQATEEDINYLLDSIHFMFPQVRVGRQDVESTWAGVRPLIRQEGKGPSEISRKDEIWTSETGLITIAGGKLTGYRKMAETITDLLCEQLRTEGISSKNSVTKELRLSGGDFRDPRDYKSFIIDESNKLSKLEISLEDATSIAAMYGTNTRIIAGLVDNVLSDSPLPLSIKLVLQYAIDYEMAVTPVDFFIRRTGAVFFDIDWVNKWKQEVVEYMSVIMGWTAEEKEMHWGELEARIWEAVEGK